MRELRPDVVAKGSEARRFEALDVLVERIDEDRKRQVPFEFGCRAREHELPTLLRARGELSE